MMGEVEISPFFIFTIFIYINKQYVIMKPEHKEKALTHLESVGNHNKVIKGMLDGSRPSSQQEALRLTNQIERLLELTKTLVELA
jgi:hypothetical protein